MLYDKYQRKIVKIADILNTVKRFRVLIILIAAVIIALLTAFLSVKGIVYSTGDIPGEIVYGENVKCDSSALFGRVAYEYAAEGSNEWSRVQPRAAGIYQIRPVSKRTFGIPSYGKAQTYRILPKEIEITVVQDVVQYGEKPAVSAGLAFNDSFEFISFIYADLSQEATQVAADKETVVISDNKGNDVTDSYIISTVTSGIAFTKRPVTVTVADTTLVYDGTPQSFDGYEVSSGSLASGDNIIAVFDSAQTAAGEIENVPQMKIVSPKGIDVTERYEINKISGKLTVEKRPVYIKTNSAEKVYDGQALTCQNYTLSGDTPLVQGHRLILTSAASLTDAGVCENLLAFKILSGDIDVTENYSFLFPADSKLKVVPRTLNIQTAGGSKIYDGKPLTVSDYTVTSAEKPLVNHKLEFVFSGSQTPAGTGANTVKEAVVTENGKPVTNNYNFVYSYGTLTVLPRQLGLQTATTELTYNGKAQSDGGYKIVSGLGLAEGDSVRDSANATITHPGMSVENIFTAEIFDSKGNNVTASYIISYVYGTLTMKPREIVVTTATTGLVFNGSAQTDTTHTISPGLGEGHTARVTNTPTTLRDVERDNAGNLISYSNEFEIAVYSGAEDVTANYIIRYVYGKLIMKPRGITVTTATAEFIYNGQEQFNNTYTINPALADGHTTRLTNGASTKLKDVVIENSSLKNFDNKFEIAVFNNGVDVTDNYSIEYIYGKLTMKPRPVTVTTATDSWTYDGKEHFNAGYNLSGNTLVEGHQLTVTSWTTVVDVLRLGNDSVGSVGNILSVQIFDGYENVTLNYEITYINGTLTVNPRSVTITTNTNSWVYDGEKHFDKGQTASENGLVDGHIITLIEWTTVLDVIRLNGTVTNVQNVQTLKIYGGEIDKTANYNISLKFGTLKILPRPVTITSNTNSWIYDGEEHYDKGCQASERDLSSGLVLGHEVTVTSYTTVINVIRLTDNSYRTTHNVITVEILYAAQNVSLNYEITYIYGKLTIEPRPITVKPEYASKQYDGTPLLSSEFIITSGNMLVGHVAEIVCTGSQTQAGKSNNTITKFRIFTWQEDVTYNYNITLLTGILEVFPRRIIVEAGSASKIFDNTPLTSRNFFVNSSSSTLVKGHTLTATTSGSQTIVGTSDNIIVAGSVKIMAFGVDVTSNYDISYKKGTLSVGYRELTLTTYGAVKPYDGLPLTNNKFDLTGDALFEGHYAVINVTGRVIIGEEDNTATISIIDSYGNDFTYWYIYNYKFGKLIVIGGPGGYEFGGSIDLNGSGGGDGGEMDPATPVFKATSSTSGTVYFRGKSFGDYLYTSWDNMPPVYSSGNINALYLMNRALAKTGRQVSRIEIEMLLDGFPYLLPYYAENGYGNSLDDTQVYFNYGNPYYVDYIYYNYNVKDTLSIGGTGYEAFESAYYQHVLRTYLQLPASTRSKLLEIARNNNLNASKPSIISDVAKFVQNKVKYSGKFEYSGDVAVYFFTEAKTGICQHYATAATAMFRALGIPARYVGGFAGQMTAGKTVDITFGQAHAWVEVYIPGAGWIEVEVTGGGPGGSGGGNGSGEGEDSEFLAELIIKPVDVYKEYDGTPLYAVNQIEGGNLKSKLILENLFSLGYTYNVVVTGSRTDYGVGESQILTLTLYDPEGNDVTGKFIFNYTLGRIRITHKPIYVHLYKLQKFYDGTPLSYDKDDYWIDEASLRAGMRVEFSLSGSLTDSGELRLSELENLPYTVYENNVNVTNQYSLVFLGDPLRIDTRAIEIASASVTKTYDGTPLTSESTWISKGFMPSGHSYEATVTGAIIDIGTGKNIISSATVYDERGRNVTANYDITFAHGTLTIKG